VDTSGERRPLLEGRGLLLLDDFCQHTGLDSATVSTLVRTGKLEGLLRLDGRVFGLYDDVLPTAGDLRALGLVVRDDYDPDQFRSYVVEDGEDDGDDDEPDDGDSSWTISWGDGRHLRVSVGGDE
jgi:hypothetical protein